MRGIGMVICPNCQIENLEGALRCKNCGMPLIKPIEAYEQSIPLSPIAQTPVQQPSIAVQKEKIPRKTLIAIILVIVIVCSSFAIYGYLLSQTQLGITVHNNWTYTDMAIGIYVDHVQVAIQTIAPGSSFGIWVSVTPGSHIVGIDYDQSSTYNLDGKADWVQTPNISLGVWTPLVVNLP